MPASYLPVRYQETTASGVLTKSGFHAAVQALVPRELLSSKERHTFSGMLNALFLLFARTDGSSSVESAEFITGFTLLWYAGHALWGTSCR